MTTLLDFPILGQLADVNEVNKEFDCVATCIAAALEYLTHKKYTGSSVKDSVYGINYIGPTNPPNYVKYCEEQGVQLSPINGNPSYLVKAIQQQIAIGNPCLITIPDRYAPASLGWTHVLSTFGYTDTSIEAMDPYIAKPVTYSNAELAGMLQFDQIWTLSGGEMVLSIQQANQFFTEIVPNDIWQCKQTKHRISHGILQYYRTCTNKDLNGVSQYGLPISEEESIPNATGCTIQRFERGNIIFDPQNALDRVPGITGPCYPAHIDRGPGRDSAIAHILSENSQLLDEITQLKQQLAEAKLPPTISTDKQ